MIQFATNSARRPVAITGRFATRHGLIAGSTGTGKSYTIARLVEQFAAAGVPSFLVDVKGDLSGIARAVPSLILDPGESYCIGVDRLGADLMSRALDLSEAQASALEIAFAFARDHAAPLRSIDGLRSTLSKVLSNRAMVARRYGHVSAASVGVVQRALMRLENDGNAALFNSPAFNVDSLLASKGATILDATRLSRFPGAYGAALLFILSELYLRLPERGDAARPRLVLFLDESHMIFREMSAPLLAKTEMIMRLIRSKGVAVFFASQSPADIPSGILGQLGNRIQHGLRGATVQDARAIRAAVETMPARDGFDACAAIARLGVGQALVSTIGPDGTPQPVELANVTAPAFNLSPLDPAERRRHLAPRAPTAEETGQAQAEWILKLAIVAAALAPWVFALTR